MRKTFAGAPHEVFRNAAVSIRGSKNAMAVLSSGKDRGDNNLHYKCGLNGTNKRHGAI